jgi:rhodanese-related sulfurtransferase
MPQPKPPRKRFTKRTIVVLVLLVVLLVGLAWDGSPLGALVLRQAVALKFRDVRRVSPGELIAWMRDPNRPPPLLVDARPADQYALSHIDGAVRIDPGQPDISRLENVRRDTPVVVYDGPGVVGAAMVKGLTDAGFRRVSSLDGGLFRWVNEGHPVVDDQGPASKVWPISWSWGRLLKARYRP